jgi:hypothetical protein
MSEIIKTILPSRTVWCLNGQLHREDGPAVEWADGSKIWCQHGKFHRLDGPAIDCFFKEWFYQDRKIDCSSQQEFDKIIKLKAFW